MIDNLGATALDSWNCLYLVTIGQTNYRHFNNQPYLRTETSYKDGIWFIALTITCQINQGVIVSHYSSVSPETKSVPSKKS